MQQFCIQRSTTYDKRSTAYDQRITISQLQSKVVPLLQPRHELQEL